jgi:hypothetical protein
MTSESTSTPKYCKVCHDAGKPESEYTTHFVRASPEASSDVVCPTLLALTCRYCRKQGHTKKYCTVLNEKDARNGRTNNHNNRNRVTEVFDKPDHVVSHMTPHDHELYRQCLGVGIPAGLLMTAFAAPRVASPSNRTPVGNGFDALAETDDSTVLDNTNTAGAGSDWTKMSHACALRRERELVDKHAVLLAELTSTKEQHRVDMLRVRNESQVQHQPAVAKTIYQLQLDLDNAIASEIEAIERSSPPPKGHKKSQKKKKNAKENTGEDTHEAITLQINAHQHNKCDHGIDLGSNTLADSIKASSGVAWGDTCDDDDDDEGDIVM